MILMLLLGCRADESDFVKPVEDTGALVEGDVDLDGYTTLDCDDADASIHPGAAELCDGVDQDCDGVVDNGVTGTFYADADGDGHGDPATAVEACEGDATVGDDCDDARPDVFPGAQEVCDGVDSDCDGAIDEEGMSLWFADADQDGFGDPATGESGCDGSGRSADFTDCDDTRGDVNPGETEVCDGVDQDCNGVVDDSLDGTWYLDADEDGFGDPATGVTACDGTGRIADATDCDDADAEVYPGAAEVCDGADQDCDGGVDEGVKTTWYIDYDSDGYGSAAYTYVACDAPAGWAATTDDCDDTEASVNPGATEVCDGVDDDCDGVVDESDAADASTWYDDLDGDGYGDPATGTVACDGDVGDGTDCDDSDADVYPGAQERYDGVDGDCDGLVDDNAWIGTGADGPLVVTGTTSLGAAYAVDAISGADVTVSRSVSTIAAGDEVLLLSVHGSDSAYRGVGTYEFAWVASVSGDIVTLDAPVVELYGETDNADLTGQAIVLQRVPQYTDVTVSGTLTTGAWDGETGGIVAFRATGTVTIAAGGAIVADGLGYAGGATGTTYGNDAFQGESYAGEGDGDEPSAAGYNAGNGAWANNYGGGGALVTGGGGEYAGGATRGVSWNGGSAAPPDAGDTYGEADLATMFFGSGGGGVWWGSSSPGPGGNGGGIVFIGASAIDADGAAAITAMGDSTTAWATGSWTYGAAGGAGGTVWLVADTVDLAAAAVDAAGGFGEDTHIRIGGDGGDGRIRVDANSVTGAALTDACEPDAGWLGVP